MTESESVALPFGDIPMSLLLERLYTKFVQNASIKFKQNKKLFVGTFCTIRTIQIGTGAEQSCQRLSDPYTSKSRSA